MQVKSPCVESLSCAIACVFQGRDGQKGERGLAGSVGPSGPVGPPGVPGSIGPPGQVQMMSTHLKYIMTGNDSLSSLLINTLSLFLRWCILKEMERHRSQARRGLQEPL